MRHLCYKSKKVLIHIYGEEIGSALHAVMVRRRASNKLLDIEENWWTFLIYSDSGHLLLGSYCK